MNQKSLIIGAVVVLIVVGGYFGRHQLKALMYGSATPTPQVTSQTSPSSKTTQNEIQIKNYSYSPESITVKVGDKVTWINQDSVGHSATADDNSFDTGVLSTGQSMNVTFSKAGTFSYHCSVHPSMKATIIVQ